jgi:UDPglucose 6-dehydrogenase
MKINVYGAELSAWVAAASLAKVGNDVVLCGSSFDGGMESMPPALDEYGLLALVEQEMAQGRLTTSALGESCVTTQIHWLALDPVEQPLAESIIQQLVKSGVEDILIINQCNFGVGSTKRLKTLLGQQGDVVYIPDNLQEGRALEGFNKPTSLIMGLDEGADLIRVKSLLRPFLTHLGAMQLMTSAEAEFTKFATTGMLALRLGYMNELANLAENSGVDISIVQEGMGADPRIGPNYLSPGCGFGGQNFQAYLSVFTDTFQQNQRSLLQTVVQENEKQKELLFRQFWQFYKGDLNGKSVALWGAAFKPGTASIDHAPSIKIIQALISQGVTVQVHDPEALKNIKRLFAEEELVVCHDDHMQAAEGVDALMLVTEWPLYWSPDYSRLKNGMNSPLVIDGRNIYDKEAMKNSGFHYIGVGR